MKCKYCEILPNGDVPDDIEEIFHMEFVDEINAEGEFSNPRETRKGTVKIEVSHHFTANALITEGNALDIMVWNNSDETFDARKRINFCPMCGRKLEAFDYGNEHN